MHGRVSGSCLMFETITFIFRTFHSQLMSFIFVNLKDVFVLVPKDLLCETQFLSFSL